MIDEMQNNESNTPRTGCPIIWGWSLMISNEDVATQNIMGAPFPTAAFYGLIFKMIVSVH